MNHQKRNNYFKIIFSLFPSIIFFLLLILFLLKLTLGDALESKVNSSYIKISIYLIAISLAILFRLFKRNVLKNSHFFKEASKKSDYQVVWHLFINFTFIFLLFFFVFNTHRFLLVFFPRFMVLPIENLMDQRQKNIDRIKQSDEKTKDEYVKIIIQELNLYYEEHKKYPERLKDMPSLNSSIHTLIAYNNEHIIDSISYETTSHNQDYKLCAKLNAEQKCWTNLNK